MAAVMGLVVGGLAGNWFWGEWGAIAGGLAGFFAGALFLGQRQRMAFRKPEVLTSAREESTQRLELRLASLEQRVIELEAALGTAPSPRPEEIVAVAPTPATSETPSQAPAQLQTPLPAPSSIPTPPSARPMHPLWAWFVGGNAMTRIGVVVLFFGVAFLLRYFAEHFTISIEVRLLGVAFAGAVLVVVGLRTARTRPAYGWSLQGAGMGVLYLTAYAAYRQFDVIGAGPALALLAIISAITVWLALLADAEALAALALSGAFLAPILTGSDRNPVPLFTYFMVVNAVVLVIASTRTWRAVSVIGFMFTFVLGLFWGDRYYRPEHFASVEPFLALFFAAYVAMSILHARRAPGAPVKPLDGLLLFGVPLVAFALQVALVANTRYGAAWSALAIAMAYAVLAWWLRGQAPRGVPLLTRSFAALAAVFASMAIPFAFENRVTAALWSIEGALVYWLGIQQRSFWIRAFACALQVAAGVLFAVSGVAGREDQLFANAFFIGVMMIAFAGLASAYLADRNVDRLANGERAAVPLIFVWGALWWIAGGGVELVRQLPRMQEAHAVLAWVTAATALAWGARRLLGWDRVLGVALALPITMLLVALRDLARDHSTLLQAGWLLWPGAWLVVFLVLKAVDAVHAKEVQTTKDAQRGWIHSAHAAAAFVLTAQIAWELSEWTGRVTAADTVWVACAAALPAIAYLALATAMRDRATWPFDTHAVAYTRDGALPIAVLLAIWVLTVNLLSPGEPFPLPYVPLANPLEIELVLALIVLFRWGRSHTRMQERDRFALLGVGIFVCINGGILRAGHHWADIPWDLSALLGSRPLQAALTLAWSLTGTALMFVAARRVLRALWMVGAALLALVVVKLFVLDLGALSGLPRVVAFLGVGGLLLLIGYLSPLPPAAQAASTAQS